MDVGRTSYKSSTERRVCVILPQDSPRNAVAGASTGSVKFVGARVALWPLPRQISTGNSTLKLAGNFDIKISVRNAPKDLQDAVSRTKSRLQSDKLERLVVGRGGADAQAVRSGGATLSGLTLSLLAGAPVRSISEEAVVDVVSRSEGYVLHVPSDGSAAALSANSTLGLLRGLSTFEQLWYDSDGTTYALGAPIDITDSPAYVLYSSLRAWIKKPYRGFMLDTARNLYVDTWRLMARVVEPFTSFPLSDIKRTLDAMSWVKINTFHWHVVDSQSFPLVVPGFKELSDKGAYNPASVYTPNDVKDIVSYAAARGIDVIAEIDTPGHTSVISKSHPEHIACPEATPWASFANEPPAGQLRVASSGTVDFTTKLIKAASKMFSSKFFSIGGDEINTNCYNNDAQTQTDLAGRTFEEALDTFTQATTGALKENGKVPVVWEG
ncbi:glycoside hydrolase family protein [Salix suchowensis]|nr:glycoside hydrolase family protein [Salix suchowensis]